ncbi:hypothetical protein [Galbitalea soli]|uniref:MmyB-like transcription regulator ligand binding domain-containing protein n=1 Tax=Galbitalea soli TaxID=1268042 RepID=A0A7C9PNY9_9MICO|nr:hypothetical protein [Galbitalea soli]
MARSCATQGEREDRYRPGRGSASRRSRSPPVNRGPQHRVRQLSARSDEFRTKWRTHDVRTHATGLKYSRHPLIGALGVVFEAAELLADAGFTLLLYSAESGRPPVSSTQCRIAPSKTGTGALPEVLRTSR